MTMSTRHRFAVAASTLLVGLSSSALAQDAVQWRVEDGGNGHWYAVIEELTLWTESVEHARNLGGELASINSTEENTLVRDLVIASDLWCGADGVWLGGHKPDKGQNNWVWTDGAPWNFTSWCPDGDGNDSGTDPSARYLQWNKYSNDPCWDDHRNTGCWDGEQGNPGYVIEWSDDCNGDGIVDYGQILDGTLLDCNANGRPDLCEDSSVVVRVPQDAPSIAEAAQLCPAGVIEVGPGIWELAVDVDGADLVIRGTDRETTILTQATDTPLNGGRGTILQLQRLTLKNVPGAEEALIFFDDCTVEDVNARFYMKPPDGRVVARNTRFVNCTPPNQPYGFLYLESERIESCEFIGGGELISAWGSKSNSIIDCSFDQVDSWAIKLIHSSLLSGCTFTDCPRPPLVSADHDAQYLLEDCTFTNCGGLGANGGAIVDDAPAGAPHRNTWTLTNCNFTDCQANEGGAIYIRYLSDLSLTDCTFTGNRSLGGQGGAIVLIGNNGTAERAELTIRNCAFTGNQTNGGAGGAIVGSYSALSIEGTTFANNVGTRGGAVYFGFGDVGGFTDCVFEANTGGDRGGAIAGYYTPLTSGPSFTNCQFIANQAGSGGAIHGQDCGYRFIDTLFEGNIANSGEAIATVGYDGNTQLDGCLLRNHGGDGGPQDTAVLVSNSTARIVAANTSFCENETFISQGRVEVESSCCIVATCTDEDEDGTPDACACPADFNGDGFVGGADLSILLGYWGEILVPNAQGDLNFDGVIGGPDLTIILSNWGGCP